MAERFPVIDGYQVDLDALNSIAHRCDPKMCGNGLSCCACYDVELTAAEARRVLDWLPEAAKFNPQLRENDGEYIDPIERTPGASPSLAVDAAERCVFAYKGPKGELWCSLHSAALAHGYAPEAVKPLTCTLWPLAISDDDDPPIVTLQPDAERFPCNTHGKEDGLDKGIAGIIERCFGAQFLRDVERRLAARRT